ncbi:MAG: anaerobic ribonucleoside triphosphate reductase, partial [Oscillospiraceae bacterium]|nr:anaerobic ribonucleoside triphosphate reductase [Oscillospiraceae bacterium]
MHLTEIRKRDGRTVPFQEEKIAEAINKAFAATYKPGQEATAERLARQVTGILETEGVAIPEVEHVQDLVEQVLMDSGYVGTAKAYILYRAEHAKMRNAE